MKFLLIKNIFNRFKWIPILLTVVIMISLFVGGNKIIRNTSTDSYCMSCHAHPHAEESLRKSTHFNNHSGIQVRCVECHLPPAGGFDYIMEKAKTGFHDQWTMWTKDVNKIDWESKRNTEHASTIVYDKSCLHCHQNLYPKNLNDNGIKSHLYYSNNSNEINCVNCHLYVGHVYPGSNNNAVSKSVSDIKFTEPTQPKKFESFTEKIPGTNVSFDMIAIPGGSFKMGSNADESFRKEDEGPVRNVSVDRFFMAKVEVSWDEFLSFYYETKTNDRTAIYQKRTDSLGVDAITGPTPPYGNPDQGWGKGKLPAITMTWHAANTYCEWLSKKTKKNYRLPTEAEWEYACRGATQTPYFFEGNPSSYSEKGFFRKVIGPDTSIINSYVVYKQNSKKTKLPEKIKANPFGLINMNGNVAEFCADWYDAKEYSKTENEIFNPQGPQAGTEHVIRGGSFRDDASDLRSATRDYTQTERWLKSDPQMPKSIWWYSNCIHVGFRVVCEASFFNE